MGYLGKERRIHRIFVTRNSEYHVRRNVCVGVRDRRSGEWLAGHVAIRSTVSGGLKFHDNGAISASEGLPTVGESLFFIASGRDLITSPVLNVERPPRGEIVHAHLDVRFSRRDAISPRCCRTLRPFASSPRSSNETGAT